MSGEITDVQSVGPVLTTGTIANAIVAAIEERNRDVRVVDRGSYVRVLSRYRCELCRTDVERHLGRPIRFPSELEMVMTSFTGSFNITDDLAVWAQEQ